MALGQSMQQRQLQRLSPQQIQLMKLLQIPTAQIEQRIKEELEENPALEMNADLLEGDMEKSVEEMKDDLLDGNIEEEEAIPVDEFEMSNEELSSYDYDDDGDIANYKTKDDYYPELDDDKVIFADDLDRRAGFDTALLGHSLRKSYSKAVAPFLYTSLHTHKYILCIYLCNISTHLSGGPS